MERQHDDNDYNVRPPNNLGGAVPSALRYDVDRQPIMPGGHRTMMRFYSSTSGSFSQGSVIRIPVSSSDYMDLNSAVLCLSVTNQSAAAADFDSQTASSIIERLRVYGGQGGSSVLDQIEHYALVSSSISSWTKTAEQRASDELLSNGGAFAAGGTLKVQIPLSYSAFFVNSTSKALPPCAWTLEVTLANGNNAFFGTVDMSGYTVNDVYLHIPSVSVSPSYSENLASMAQSQGGTISWTACGIQTSFGSLQGVGPQAVPINSRVSSLRALVSILRESANLNDETKYSSRHSIGWVSQFQYEIAGRMVPPQAVTVALDSDVGAAFSELIRIWASMSSCSTGTSYAAFNGPTNIGSVASGALGVCVEQFEDGGVISGLDVKTLGQQISLRCSTTAATVLEVFTMCLHDVVYSLDVNTGALTVTD